MNDYSQIYVNNGQRPQNSIINHNQDGQFERDYPRESRLIKLKTELLQKRNHPPLVLNMNLKELPVHYKMMGKFDIILVDPPWEEYKQKLHDTLQHLEASPEVINNIDKTDERFQGWSKDDIGTLPIKDLSEDACFVFMWVGASHLEDGRELFSRWGFKRCEDVVWLKTNHESPAHLPPNDKTYLQRVKEHCLVGYKGEVNRASDDPIIHANIDTDVIVKEEKPLSPLEKPSDIYDIIERFALGRRRLQLFNNGSPRAGWLTVTGSKASPTNVDWQEYDRWLSGPIEMNGYIGGRRIGTTPEIESLRPKSPKNRSGPSGGGPGQPSGGFGGWAQS